MAPTPRRRKPGQRRRLETGADERPETIDLDDDSATEGSAGLDDHNVAPESDTTNIDDASPTSANLANHRNGAAKRGGKQPSKTGNGPNHKKSVADTEAMLKDLSLNDKPQADSKSKDSKSSPAKQSSAPMIVSSASAAKNPPGQQTERRRQDQDDYKRRKDQDPAFVPNRGNFFMHDSRNSGHPSNGLRQLGRGGRGRGRGNYGGSYNHIKYVVNIHTPRIHSIANKTNSHSYQQSSDPTTSGQWAHDMHDSLTEPTQRRHRHESNHEGPANGNGYIPTCKDSEEPINRILSTEKQLGKAQVRVVLPQLNKNQVFPGMIVKQYTKLPDHRPPLRRDKPVRISLPGRPPRYIFPASDRSFTFIPRALRPNQQRARGKPRSAFGSMGGFSRRTSIYGGSYFGSNYGSNYGSTYGSVYSPSVDMSRRSSVVYDQTPLFSPTGSVISRAPVPLDNSRPIVRLPPAGRLDLPMGVDMHMPYDQPMMPPPVPPSMAMPPPQLPTQQDPPDQHRRAPSQDRRDSQSSALPMHQPRPQKNISVADIEPPTPNQSGNPAFQQAFHQQVPFQVGNNQQHGNHARHMSHASHNSHSSQHGARTPSSYGPDGGVHATPFQPAAYGQQPYYNQQQYQGQQSYYYPPGYAHPNMNSPGGSGAYTTAGSAAMAGGYSAQGHHAHHGSQGGSANANLVAQEVNGMVYYYDAAQIPPTGSYPSYSNQGYQPGTLAMQGMMTPSPDAFYYSQQAPNMAYYPQ